MDLAEVMSMISTVGFPCAMCLILLVQSSKQTEIHKQELTALTAAVNTNSLSIQRLTDRLEVRYEGNREGSGSNKTL